MTAHPVRTPPAPVFRRGAVPLDQKLVPVDEEVLAEQRALHTPDLAAPDADRVTVHDLRALWSAAEPDDPTHSTTTRTAWTSASSPTPRHAR